MKANYFYAVASLVRLGMTLESQQPLIGQVTDDNVKSPSVNLEAIINASPLLSFHRDIVQIPSISENEKSVGNFLLDFIRSHNLTVEKQIVTPENLVIAGRGTVDAKASVAAILFAALETLDVNPDASIGLLFDVGEEKSGVGMKHFSDSDLNPAPPTFHTVIFGEPTELKLVAGHKGTLGFKVVAEGKAAHSGYPWLGKSAISSILPVLSYLDTLQDIQPEKGGLLRSETFGQSTLNIGVVRAGLAGNVVPAYAEATISIRLAAGSPDDTREIVRKAVEDVTAGDASVYLDFGNLGNGAPPQYLDFDVDGFDVITVNYGTDIPALKINTQEGPKVKRYLYGPGSIHVAHGDDEAITVGELEEAVRGYKKLISAALGAH
ncbi:hypothetical protein N7465_001941 [Penicillium sp. CMV-2018d]|nr:hypothetical protein N7465_001941 [Penicillium sp. CMV-2018d]